MVYHYAAHTLLSFYLYPIAVYKKERDVYISLFLVFLILFFLL